MTLLLCQAGLNLVQTTSQRYDTVALSGSSSRRQVKEMTLLLCQAGWNLIQKTSQRDDCCCVTGLNLFQKTSQRDDTVAVSGSFEPRPEDK